MTENVIYNSGVDRSNWLAWRESPEYLEFKARASATRERMRPIIERELARRAVTPDWLWPLHVEEPLKCTDQLAEAQAVIAADKAADWVLAELFHLPTDREEHENA